MNGAGGTRLCYEMSLRVSGQAYNVVDACKSLKAASKLSVNGLKQEVSVCHFASVEM
jgi:hypothetical protein